MLNTAESITSVEVPKSTNSQSGVRKVDSMRKGFNMGAAKSVCNPVEREIIEMRSLLNKPVEHDSFTKDLIRFISIK